jgi:NAD(P)-dependent dehydrogenase (short-subunit alcohol dehydrogenase family)
VTTTLAEQGQSAVPSALTALTKGGLVAVTKSLAVEYGGRDIRVNAISPGVIDTPMHSGVDAHDAYAGTHPQNRIGAVADVVRGSLYLENAPFVTGRSFMSTADKARGTESAIAMSHWRARLRTCSTLSSRWSAAAAARPRPGGVPLARAN